MMYSGFDWQPIAARHASDEFLNPLPTYYTMKNTVKTPREVQLSARQKAEANMKAYAALATKRKKAEDKHKAAMKALETQLEGLEGELNRFAAENEATEFHGQKSLKLAAGTIGWRVTPGRLDYAQDGATPEHLRDVLVKRDPLLLRVDAAAVIKHVATDAPLALTLQAMGITVKQEDKFYVKPA
jgi:phage host-nuclease inhibitor protein Gam